MPVPNQEWLILITILSPLAGSLAAFKLGALKEFWRDMAAAVAAFVAFFASLLLFAEVIRSGPVTYQIDWFMMLGLDFNLSPTGGFLLLLSSFIWFLAVVFSWTYMEHEHSRSRYYFSLLLTEVGCLGVFLAGNLFTLFLFFELMSVVSYLLVVHKESGEALDAGRSYLYLGIGGGLSLLLGIILLHAYLGTTEIASNMELMHGQDIPVYLVAALMITGFGIKAGMIPLHIWLPRAHPVAPSPASALLSGIMIKTGAYGILLTTNLLFAAPADNLINSETRFLGFVLIWVAITTMFLAAFMALFQSNIKRILAYSSISQMGYILMGIGCAAYMGGEGMMGFSGSLYHIFNHAFFKAGMFMMVGAVYARTHHLEISRLGGMKKQFPFTAAAFVVAACGIAGVPLFNGYASKTLLHHAIEDAYYYGGHASLYYAEIVFTVTSALTVCYIFKLIRGVFWGAPRQDYGDIKPETVSEKLVLGTMASVIVLVGLMPHQVLNSLIIPLSGGFAFQADNVAYLADINLWVPYDLWNIVQALAAGLLLYYIMYRTRLFEARLPGWLSVDYLVFRPGIKAVLYLYEATGASLEKLLDRVLTGTPAVLEKVTRSVGETEEKVPEVVWEPALEAGNRYYTESLGAVDGTVDKIFTRGDKPGLYLSQQLAGFDRITLPRAGRVIGKAAARTRDGVHSGLLCIINAFGSVVASIRRKAFIALIKADYDPRGDRFFEMINPFNYNFDLIVVWLVLLMLFILFFVF